MFPDKLSDVESFTFQCFESKSERSRLSEEDKGVTVIGCSLLRVWWDEGEESGGGDGRVGGGQGDVGTVGMCIG